MLVINMSGGVISKEAVVSFNYTRLVINFKPRQIFFKKYLVLIGLN